MNITENIVGKMMMREIDPTVGNDLLDLALMVQLKCTCDCGSILDFKTSVAIRVGDRAVTCFCATCYDTKKEHFGEMFKALRDDPKISEEIPAGDYSCVDGRLYTSKYELRKESPPVKPAKPKPRARVNVGEGIQEVEYSKRFEGSGLTWFIHGKKKEWTVTQWECGLRLGVYDTQKQGIAAASNLTPEQVNIARGSISLHKINPPVKKGGKS